MPKKLRLNQEEACDAAVRLLTPPASGLVPPQGLRCQIRAATGAGKSLTAVHVAGRLRSERTLVIVPSLPLLEQTVEVWQREGHSGLMVGLCSLVGNEQPVGLRCTTDPAQLVKWTAGPGKVTVFATYASLGLGHLEKAHQAGLEPFSLAIVDEAHRVSGQTGRPWAAILNNTQIPCDRRLFMTATPRLWAVKERDRERAAAAGIGSAELIASMDDESLSAFGPIAHDYPLGQAISDGVIAPYRIVCVDVSDPVLQGLEQRGASDRSVEYRGARLAALQTALLTACAEWDLSRVLSFHHLVTEARALSAGLPEVARVLWEQDPALHPDPELIGTSWLEAEHTSAERRAVLGTFASLVRDDGWRLLRYILASVKVLSEGVDTFDCDAVFFADVRGSMVDLVQAVGRALRMKPGSGKVATIVVPVLLGASENGSQLLTSPAYDGLSKLLMALRAHDAAAVERLAMPQSETRPPRKPKHAGEPEEFRSAAGQAQLLQFSTQRDPAVIAAFVRTRVLEPERAEFRRGLEELLAYREKFGDVKVPYAYRAPSGHRLGAWVADQRRYKAADVLDPERVKELNALGMVWSAFDTAFTDNLTAVAGYAAKHGHACPPNEAVWGGRPVGTIMKNLRTAQRRTEALQRRAEAGEQDLDWTGALTADRKAALDAIDPAWCPTWSVEWQRSFALAWRHVKEGGQLAGAEPGSVVVQGEDLAGWGRAQQVGWDKLSPAQQWAIEHVLGLEPLPAEQKPAGKVSHAEKERRNLAAATQYRNREGHLNVPRTHKEPLTLDDGTTIQISLGLFITNTRNRRAHIPTERAARLTELGMRWE
ncbi:Helicase associated domain protein [Kitasatospora aureofaciens]|uniref:DEAD/DEAH box helicase n=1 Tax=Kitasatospora aureofaciens TaxID=1894 RepID=UPI001C44F480|nr:DEAD/DEAH box helicase [Kitasatospora aureofaciens]MBV6701943.1 Helicase associated domain protein [Kitasatospora aureofaciens]